MSTLQVNNLTPLTGSIIYVTGTLSASAGFGSGAETISGSLGKFTTLTASNAYIDTLDVNVINSVTTTETSLEISDKLIIAASGATAASSNEGGYQIGGYSTTTYPPASMIFSGSALKFNVTGSTTPILYLSGSGVAGIGTITPSSQAGITTFLEIQDPSSAGIVLDDTGGREWNIYSADSKLYHWNSSDGHVLTFWGKDVGIGTSTPATRFDIVDTRSYQFRLSYDSSNYVSFGASSGGDLTVSASGGDITFSNTTSYSKVLKLNSGAYISGNVGIGTSAPTDMLTVAADLSSGTNAGIHVAGNLDGDAYLDLTEQGESAVAAFAATDAYGFRIVYDGGAGVEALQIKSGNESAVNTRMTIKRDTGNVGIGTDSPTYKFSVTGSTSVSGSSHYTGSAYYRSGDKLNLGGTAATVHGNGASVIVSGSTIQFTGSVELNDSLVITDGTFDGVDIGTNTAGSGIFTTLAAGSAFTGSAGAQIDGGVVFNELSADVDFRVESNDNANMLFVDGGNNRVGIGTASPDHTVQIEANSDTHGLQVNGAQNKYTVSLRSNTTTGQAYGAYIRGGTNSSDAALEVDNASGGTTYFKIRGDGNVGIGHPAENPEYKLDIAPDTSSALRIKNIFDGLDVNCALENTGTDSGDGTTLSLTTQADAHDPSLRFSIAGNETWSMGIDNSDGDKFKISGHSQLETDTRITLHGPKVGIGTTSPSYTLDVTGTGQFSSNLIVGGNLTVNGTTTTVNSTTITVDDPIFTLGGDTAPGSDDNKDRGIEFRYYDSSAKIGFFGYDDSEGEFTGFTAATNSSEVFSGTRMNANFGSIASTSLTVSDTHLVVTGGKVGIGMADPSDALEIDGDIQLTPTAISTAHIKTTGSLRIRASANIYIGDDGADSIRLGRTNTTAMKIHLRSGADTDLVVSNSKVGIGTDSPDAALHVAGAAAFSGPSETFVTFSSSDTTPSVATGNLFKTHASAQTLTDFDDGVAGQTITVISTAAVVFDVTSSGLKGGSTNITTASGDVTTWTYDGTDWYLIQFMDVSANLSSPGASASVTALNNATANELVTVGSTTTELDAESNLTFDGSTLTVTGHQLPGADNTYDLGSSSYRYRNIYTGDLHLRNERGDWTILEEEDFLCVINNKTGKKYEMMLKPIED